MLAAETGRFLPSFRIFFEQGFEFSVEPGGFQWGEGLVQDVLILFREELPESVREAGADPDPNGLPAQALDGRKPSCSADQESLWGDGDRLQQPVTFDGGNEGVHFAVVTAMPVPDLDGCGGPFDDDARVVRHDPSPPDPRSRQHQRFHESVVPQQKRHGLTNQ